MPIYTLANMHPTPFGGVGLILLHWMLLNINSDMFAFCCALLPWGFVVIGRQAKAT